MLAVASPAVIPPEYNEILEKVRIETLPKKLLVGKCLAMSRRNDRTPELWKSFMPHRNAIANRVGSHFFSMQIYPEQGHAKPESLFTKWAVVEVTRFDAIPDGMETYEIEGGRYAVFVHRGPASTFSRTFAFIFQEWLPASGFTIDSREHFEVLEEGYSPIDPEASEEIWIPIK
jgi:AraC family transcriptional regulator